MQVIESKKNSILIALNLFFVLALVLAYIGSVVSPLQFILPIYFIIGFPIILIVNVLFIAYWIYNRKWYFLISTLALILLYKSVFIIFPVHFKHQTIENAKKQLVIISYNTNSNSKVQKHCLNNPNGVIKYLLDENPDIICIQEYYVKNDSAHLTQLDVNKIFEKYPYKYIKFDYNNYDNMTGLATFSKYPIINTKRIKYESIFNASMYSDIVIQNETIRVFNNHLESNRFSGNDLMLSQQLKNDMNGFSLLNKTQYFSQKLQIAYPVRAKQAEAVSEIIKSTPYKVIVCGDFNDVPLSYAYTKVKGKLNDAFVENGTGFGWTYYSSTYKLRLDYIFYDANFEVLNFEIGKNKSSDHYPIKCVLKMKF